MREAFKSWRREHREGVEESEQSICEQQQAAASSSSSAAAAAAAAAEGSGERVSTGLITER